MYCKNCGQEIDNQAVVCPYCGVPQKNLNDSGSIGWGVLGCCFPIVGLILWLIWRDDKPNTAKMAGIGALVSVGIVVIWYIFMAILGVASAML